MSYLIGIDGGGTACRAVIATRDGTALGYGHAGPANIATDLEGAFKNIRAAAGLAAHSAGFSQGQIVTSSAVLGLAGANIAKWDQVLLPLLPFASSKIVSDGQIALYGALGDADGAVASLGTGSVFLSQRNQAFRTIGGWGFVLGDLCSGAHLGRSLLQKSLLAYDNVCKGSPLTDAVLAGFDGNPGALVEYAKQAEPRDFGEFSPLIFDYEEGNDPIAMAIINEAMNDLEGSLQALTQGEALPFCLLGGLADKYSTRLREPFKSLERSPNGDALQGAIFLAMKTYGATSAQPLRRIG